MLKYIVFIIFFVLHESEEVAVQRKWMISHANYLRDSHPWLQGLINYLCSLTTSAFLIAVIEELILLVAVTVYVYMDGAYCMELWSSVVIAFSIHLVIHVFQSIIIKGYVPGLVTSILLLPFSLHLLNDILNANGFSYILLWGMIGTIFVAFNLIFAHWLGVKAVGLYRR